MKTYFCKLALGDRFNDGVDGIRYLVLEKTSKSQAKVVEQHGYGNQRMVGGTQKFGAFHPIWKYEK